MLDTLTALRPPPRIALLSILATLTLWLGQGCAATDNDRLTVGGEYPPTFAPPAQRADALLAPAIGPSLRGASRDHWVSTPIVVAVDGAEHHPALAGASSGPAFGSSLRHRGFHPTEDSALELGACPLCQAHKGGAAPFYAGAGVLMLIPRAARTNPIGVAASPLHFYERYRENETAANIGVPATAPTPELQPERAPVNK